MWLAPLLVPRAKLCPSLRPTELLRLRSSPHPAQRGRSVRKLHTANWPLLSRAVRRPPAALTRMSSPRFAPKSSTRASRRASDRPRVAPSVAKRSRGVSPLGVTLLVPAVTQPHEVEGSLLAPGPPTSLTSAVRGVFSTHEDASIAASCGKGGFRCCERYPFLPCCWPR